MLIEGRWQQSGLPVTDASGRMQRAPAQLRNWVTEDGSVGPSGDADFQAEAGRYHLYVSRACPWAHRTTIMRELKGLTHMIGLSVTHWLMAEQGWTFEPGPGVVPDDVNGKGTLWQVYVASEPNYTGRVTVPVLWDKKQGKIVSNESSDILRMFNSAFDRVGALRGDYYPRSLRTEIDGYNERFYATLNNGVYRAGFAGTQEAYEAAVLPVFATLDWLDGILAKRRFLCGRQLTEADIRLFATLLRFDLVYHGHFKCNLRRLADYRNLLSYTRELYQYPGVRGTVDIDHIKRHYYE